MIFALIGAILGGLLLLAVSLFILSVVVKAVVKLLKKLKEKSPPEVIDDGGSATVLTKEEAEVIFGEIGKKRPDLETSIRNKVGCSYCKKTGFSLPYNKKLFITDTCDDHYGFGLMEADDTSQDELKYGGKVFENGMVVTWDEFGREHRKLYNTY